MKKITYEEACKSYKTQKQFLEFYYIHFKNFWTQYQMNGLFTKWHLYGTTEYKQFYKDKNYLPNNRQILPIEIVFDIDAPKREDNHRLRDVISDNLTKELRNHSVWRNGSKSGNHIHSFFPDLENYSTSDRLMIKQLIIEYYAGTDNVKNFKVDMNVSNSKKLIMLERGRHRKDGGIKYLVRFHSFGKFNSIPQKVLDKFYNTIKPKMDNIDFIDLSVSEKPCVSFFEKEEFTNCKEARKRAVFILASEYTRRGMPKTEISHKLKKWRDYVLNGYKGISDHFIDDTVKRSNGRVSCKMRSRILQEIGMESVARRCPICRKFLT